MTRFRPDDRLPFNVQDDPTESALCDLTCALVAQALAHLHERATAAEVDELPASAMSAGLLLSAAVGAAAHDIPEAEFLEAARAAYVFAKRELRKDDTPN